MIECVPTDNGALTVFTVQVAVATPVVGLYVPNATFAHSGVVPSRNVTVPVGPASDPVPVVVIGCAPLRTDVGTSVDPNPTDAVKVIAFCTNAGLRLLDMEIAEGYLLTVCVIVPVVVLKLVSPEYVAVITSEGAGSEDVVQVAITPLSVTVEQSTVEPL